MVNQLQPLPHVGHCPAFWLDPCECGSVERSSRLRREFFAYLDAGQHTLFCRRCGIREGLESADRGFVHDVAVAHAKQWHP